MLDRHLLYFTILVLEMLENEEEKQKKGEGLKLVFFSV